MYGEEVSGYNNIFDNNVTCLWRDGYGEGTFGKTTGGSCEWSRRSSRDFMGTGKKADGYEVFEKAEGEKAFTKVKVTKKRKIILKKKHEAEGINTK